MGLYSEAAELERKGVAFAVVTITNTEGVVPRKSGRMLVSEEGEIFGTIGGGEIEYKAKLIALEALSDGKCRCAMITHGEGNNVSVFVDIPEHSGKVIIVGKGHVGNAVSSLFKSIGWGVRLLDRNADSSQLLSERIDRKTAIIIAGKAGASLISPVLSTEAFYVGLLASRSFRTIPDKRLYFPIGLDIGEETPEEIAISIAAEVLAVFNKRPASSNRDWERNLVVVRGAGDLATGTIVRLVKAGYKVIALEAEKPTVIRRTVSLAEAVYEKEMVVEGVKGILVSTEAEVRRALDNGNVPIMIDTDLNILTSFHPAVLVDAIIAKHNLGTRTGLAPFVVALGPGFTAGVDADAVIETKRGHTLGSVIYSGSAIPNTGIPGNIAGYAAERVIHSPARGVFKGVKHIGDIVRQGEVIAFVGDVPVTATINGKLRGLLHDGLSVPDGFKIADIDPRGEEADHTTISDKARAIAGGVLEAIDGWFCK